MKINLYKKNNGEMMIYLNDYAKNVSLGVGERVFTSKITKGQKGLLNRFFQGLKELEPTIKDFKECEAHAEPKADLAFDLKLFVTDIAKVAGNDVGADGAYLAYENNLYSISEFNEILQQA